MFGFNVAEGPSLFKNEVFLDSDVLLNKVLNFCCQTSGWILLTGRHYPRI